MTLTYAPWIVNNKTTHYNQLEKTWKAKIKKHKAPYLPCKVILKNKQIKWQLVLKHGRIEGGGSKMSSAKKPSSHIEDPTNLNQHQPEKRPTTPLNAKKIGYSNIQWEESIC